MIRIYGLHKQYGEHTVLSDVNLHLKAGEFAFLKGCSGSGKSTLLKLLYQDIEEYTGRIEVEGEVLGKGQQEITARGDCPSAA
ncbi:ATP-binding cassette domain-containing protein [Aneurinibacillus sp. REN35]|uniref:ATP-binding cassette domain-containing protein n=1 Tax=Aneurinibacillus sp. REN35 TaxID=3237286 RepID=UPI0035289B1C